MKCIGTTGDHRCDRQIFNKSEGNHLWFSSESENFQPNNIDWGEDMLIKILGSKGDVVHVCTPKVSEGTISIEEFVDVSSLECGDYKFELSVGFYDLYEFSFRIVNLPSSFAEYATFSGAQLRGVYKNGVVDDEELVRFDSKEFESLFLSFSFSDIATSEDLQCMVAIYDNSFDIDIEEVEDNERMSQSNTLSYNKKLEDFDMIAGSYRLEIKMFGEYVEVLNFEVI